jgi:regulator of cell morphogenesis and NO signaling
MNHDAEHSFSSLQCEHADLERVFEKHQRALISRDVPTAFATIVTFESNLKRHIAFEEEVLLPLYKTKGGEVEGGTLPIFQAEHRKLREIVARLARHTDGLYTTPDILGAILELLDEEALFKGLMAHHTLREQNLLFPRLDALTAESEREKMLEEHFA